MKFQPLANTFFLHRFADEGCRCLTWRRGYQVYAVQFPADQVNRICWAWILFSQVLRHLPLVEIAHNDPTFSDFYQMPNCTVWKFHYFPITQILREINFGESRRSKTAIFAIFGPLNFVNLVIFSRQKVQKLIKDQNSQPRAKCAKMAKMTDFALLDSPKLISRKIWVIGKSWNFHTVNSDFTV